MQRQRRQKEKHQHFCLLVNEQATRYSERAVSRLISAIKRQGGRYTVLRPDSAVDLIDAARAAAGSKRGRRFLPAQFTKRGKVTGLVACGGDGTFNLVARVAVRSDLPIGCLPLGRFNNIAMSLYRTTSTDIAIEKITSRNYRKIDVGDVAEQLFFGSVGLGFVPEMSHLLEGRKRPRFMIGWSRLASRAANIVKPVPMVIRVDSFRFEIAPTILNINLLPHTLGLPLTTASIPDDSLMEVVLDIGVNSREIASFTRQTSQGKYIYGDSIRLFRGRVVTLQPTRGRKLYLDGELVDIPTNVIDVHITESQLKVYA